MFLSWEQFKEEVDKEIEKQGIDPKTEIWFIDVSNPQDTDFKNGAVCINVDRDLGTLAISV